MTEHGELVNQLIALRDSTTLWLEFHKGMTLQIKILDQCEEDIFGFTVIKRKVKLFFESDESPALYCISYLDRNRLTNDEYNDITNKEVPIYKLFMKFNDPRLIRKENVNIVVEMNEEVSKKLNVQSAVLYKKEYDFWVADRKIGRIIEIFNEESLSRTCENI